MLFRSAHMPAPYAQLHKVVGLIERIEQINNELVEEKRQHALTRLDEKISQLQSEINKHSIISADISNQLLRPLQLVKNTLEKEPSIGQIYYLQTKESDDVLNESLDRLEQYLQQQKPVAPPASAPSNLSETQGTTITTPPKPPAPKPVVEVSAAQVYSQLNQGEIGRAHV